MSQLGSRARSKSSDQGRRSEFSVVLGAAPNFDEEQGPIEPVIQQSYTIERHIAQQAGQEAPMIQNNSEQHGDADSDGDAEVMEPIPEQNRLTLEFKDVCIHVPASFEQPSVKDRFKSIGNLGKRATGSKTAPSNRNKQVLFNVTGEVVPGQILALMGPSGSGKTSLLSVIGFRVNKALDVTGSITVNGKPVNKAIKRRIGYVLQDDLLYESLTVFETLMYAAILRLPKTMTRKEKIERVETVIKALGLQRCRESIIGGFMRRGISGGERKRVSVGHELLINPGILMLDEPTSGLDSTTALHLLSLLKELAAGGRAIVTTIHQPSSRLYSNLDRLMLLAQGHIVYYGDANCVAPWLGHLGFRMPYGVNVADFILDAAMGEADYTGPGKPEQAPDGHNSDQKATSIAPKFKGQDAIKALYETYEAYARQHPEGYRKGADLSNIKLLADVPTSTTAVADSHWQQSGELQQVVVSPSRGDSTAETASTAGDHDSEYAAAQVFIEPDLESGKMYAGDGRHAGIEAGTVGPATGTRGPGTTAAGGLAKWEGGPGGGHHNAAFDGVEDDVTNRKDAKRDGAPYWEQLTILTRRCAKVKRFEAFSLQKIIQVIVVAFITGMFWFRRGDTHTISAAGDVLGLLFFIMLFPSISSLFAALFTFPGDYRMLLKERASGMYKLSAFYFARTFSDLPMDCLLPTIFVIIAYWMGGLIADGGIFISTWLSVLLLVLLAQSVGLLIGAVFMDPKTAQTVCTIVLLTFMLVAGFYVKDIPVWISWLKYISFIYWGFNLVIKIQFSNQTWYTCDAQGCTPVADIKDALGLMVDPSSSPWLEIVVLFVFLAAARIGIYVVLRLKTAQKK